MRLAAELAASEINETGGVRGRRLEILARDDSGQADVAIRVARDFRANTNVVAVIGHLTSSATVAAASVYNADPNPLVEISPSASSPLISEAGPFTFRTCPTNLEHGSKLAEWALTQLGAERAAILYDNDAYGRGVRNAFKEVFEAGGGRLLSDDPYIPELPGFDPYLRRLRQRGEADVLLVAGRRAEAERILEALNTLRMSPTVLGGDELIGVEKTTANDQAVYISTAYLPGRRGERNQEFVAAYGRTYTGESPDHGGAGAYDIVHLLARTIRAVGTDRQAIRDYLAGVGTQSDTFDGATGTISFDQSGDVPDKDVVIGVARGGNLITAPGR